MHKDKQLLNVDDIVCESKLRLRIQAELAVHLQRNQSSWWSDTLPVVLTMPPTELIRSAKLEAGSEATDAIECVNSRAMRRSSAGIVAINGMMLTCTR